jgi:hypothetical protein
MPGQTKSRLWKFSKKEVDEWAKSGATREKDDEDQRAMKDRSR